MADSTTINDKDLQDKAKEVIAEYLKARAVNSYGRISDVEYMKTILALSADQQLAVLISAIECVYDDNSQLGPILHDANKIREVLSNPRGDRALRAELATDSHFYNWRLKDLISFLCKRVPVLSEDQLLFLIRFKISEFFYGIGTGDDERYSDAIICAEKFAKTKELSSNAKVFLNLFAEFINRVKTGQAGSLSKPARNVIARIQALTQTEDDTSSSVSPIVPEDAWADRAIADLQAMNLQQRKQWFSLFAICQKASSTKPSAKWSKEAESIIAEIGEETFVRFAESWFSIFPSKSSIKHDPSWLDDVMKPENQDLLRGLAWCCGPRKDAKLALALGNAAESCFKKVPNFGPRSKVVGNACLYALSEMNTKEAISQLSRVQTRAKHASSQLQIEKALNRAADHAGMSVEDLQDIGVPDFGLSQDRQRIEQFGEFSAELTVSDVGEVELNWRNSAGKSQQSVPATVKKDFAAQLKALKKVKDDLEKVLSTTTRRVEQSLINQRHWTFSSWKERYLDHPVSSVIARRLLWNFNGKTGIWHKGKIVDLQGKEVKPEDSEIVELWHPISVEPATVLSWRRWLLDHNVTQPFKQCYREIYVLTDAEKQTNTYSNRFAGHILRQHQFQQLCSQRNWTYRLMGSFDSHNVPTIHLPKWNMSVEFWVDFPEGADQGIISESGIATIVVTDQVRFSRKDHGEIALTEIVPIVFSEVMRDVDLFVSVCSIGTDPNYTGGYGDYWRHFSFGDLTVAGTMRKQVLSDLLPMLKIADRCEIREKFLVVRGDLRTYKIHLGSANILMEPNDQYLCIVSSRGSQSASVGPLRLPFEGDSVLSLILSKAFMLAEDAKIKDQSITGQIGHRG